MAVTIGKAAALWKLRALLKHPGKFMRVVRDPRTPNLARFAALAAVTYIFLPFDIAPDFFPFFGQLDDAAILVFLTSFMLRMIPKEVFKSAGLPTPSEQ